MPLVFRQESVIRVGLVKCWLTIRIVVKEWRLTGRQLLASRPRRKGCWPDLSCRGVWGQPAAECLASQATISHLRLPSSGRPQARWPDLTCPTWLHLCICAPATFDRSGTSGRKIPQAQVHRPPATLAYSDQWTSEEDYKSRESCCGYVWNKLYFTFLKRE